MDNEPPSGLLDAMLNQIKIDATDIKRLIEQQIKSSYKKKEQQEDISKEITRRLRIQNKKLLEQVKLLKEQLKHSSTERSQATARLNRLVKLNNSLADALGSCSHCWGKDSDCPNCSGEGSPGWRNVNKRLFNLYILPVLQ